MVGHGRWVGIEMKLTINLKKKKKKNLCKNYFCHFFVNFVTFDPKTWSKKKINIIFNINHGSIDLNPPSVSPHRWLCIT